MNLIKFDYVVDAAHILVRLGEEARKTLAALCPVLVGKLSASAARESNASLYVTHSKALEAVEFVSLLSELATEGGVALPEDLQDRAARAWLVVTVAGAELAKRYVDGTLNPVYHDGGSASDMTAKATYEQEKQNKAAVLAITGEAAA